MWETEFCATDSRGRRIEYQTKNLAHHSAAERPDRVLISGKVEHKGWASDHQGYAKYVELIRL